MSLEKIPDVLRALAEEHVDYVLIGAVAMMAQVGSGNRDWTSSATCVAVLGAMTIGFLIPGSF